jgi:hypothetical protein
MKRHKEQESGNVLRWYEGKGVTASLVKGDFPNEKQLRVSNKKGSMMARGHFKDNISDKEMERKIKILARSIR